MSPTRVSPVSFLKLSADVASFYGFRSMRDIKVPPRAPAGLRRSPSFMTAANLCGACVVERPLEPSLAFYATPAPSHMPHTYAPRETGEFGLCVAGSADSAGEILILKTLSAILSEWGTPVARVRLNAMGDKDSKERFGREMGIYVRRRAAELDEACRADILRAPLAPRACGHDACLNILAEGPRSVNYLSERSRSHFRKVLEQIEGLGFPYEIDDSLLGDEREQHVLFALDLASPDATIVGSLGGRYDDYLRRQMGRKEGAAVSASIYFRKKGAVRDNFFAPPLPRAPKVFFVQLGPLAKLHGLSVLDTLRRAKLPVSQSFDSSRLSPQLIAAQRPGVSHLLIMGQREALDGTIIVRLLKNGSQSTVRLSELPRVLKTLRP